MVKTISEFGEEIKEIRAEIKEKGKNVDAKLVASWLDRTLISLESLSVTLDLLAEDMEQLSDKPSVLDKIGEAIKGKPSEKEKPKKTEKKAEKTVAKPKTKEKHEKKEKKGFWPF